MSVFWVFHGMVNPMLYAMTTGAVIFPIPSIVISFFIGRYDYWGNFKWISPILFGFSYTFWGACTYDLANTLSAGHLNPLNLDVIPYGAIFSVVGLIVGSIIRYKKKNRK